MDFRTYQTRAWEYDQHHDEPNRGLTIALLGLGGEVGTLQTTQKKIVRDGDGHSDSHQAALEDLGDILWYVADAATWLGEDLDAVAEANLRKIGERWPRHGAPLPSQVPVPDLAGHRVRTPVELGPAHLFDGTFPDHERLPRRFDVHFAEIPGTDRRVLPLLDGRPCGNRLGDNSYDPDGYRWHDCFHLGYLAVLGWSPVQRSLLKRKRKSNPQIDDVEDGGRAVAIEEGISALVFQAAQRTGFYEAVRTVDGELLRTVRRLVEGLETRICTTMEWERAILDGYDAWRSVRDAGHGAVACDLEARRITARPLSAEELEHHHELSVQVLADEEEERRIEAEIRAARAAR